MNEGAEVTLVARMRIVHVLYIVWTQPQLGLPQHWTWTWVEGVWHLGKDDGQIHYTAKQTYTADRHFAAHSNPPTNKPKFAPDVATIKPAGWQSDNTSKTTMY